MHTHTHTQTHMRTQKNTHKSMQWFQTKFCLFPFQDWIEDCCRWQKTCEARIEGKILKVKEKIGNFESFFLLQHFTKFYIWDRFVEKSSIWSCFLTKKRSFTIKCFLLVCKIAFSFDNQIWCFISFQCKWIFFVFLKAYVTHVNKYIKIFLKCWNSLIFLGYVVLW